MCFVGRKKTLMGDLMTTLRVISLAHTVVNDEVGHAKEIEDLHEQARNNEAKNIGYETKIVDL